MVTDLTEARQETTRNEGEKKQRSGRRTLKSWWFFGPMLLMLTVVSGGVAGSPSAGDGLNKAKAKIAPVLTVTTMKAEMQTFERKILITGSITAVDELAIGTETSGLALKEVLVDVGDKVKKGQLLARFNDATLRADLQQKEGALIEARANLQEADANFQRAAELTGKGAVSSKDFDNRQATAISMRSRVVVAEAAKDASLVALSNADVWAPAAGTIISRKGSIGAVWFLGGGELFKMIRDDRVEMIADVPEGDLALVRPGQQAKLKLENSDIDLQGIVRLIEPTVDPSTRLGRVRIEVSDSEHALPGMFLSGYLSVKKTQAIVVPSQAVLYKKDKPFVFLLDADNRVIARPIEIAGTNGTTVSIKSGIAPGDEIAVAGAGYLKDGDNVEVATGETGGAKPSVAIEQ